MVRDSWFVVRGPKTKVRTLGNLLESAPIASGILPERAGLSPSSDRPPRANCSPTPHRRSASCLQRRRLQPTRLSFSKNGPRRRWLCSTPRNRSCAPGVLQPSGKTGLTSFATNRRTSKYLGGGGDLEPRISSDLLVVHSIKASRDRPNPTAIASRCPHPLSQ